MLSVNNAGQNNYNTTFGCKKIMNAVREKRYQDGLIKLAEESGKVSKEQLGEMRKTAALSRLADFIPKGKTKISPQEFDKIALTDPVANAAQKLKAGLISKGEFKEVVMRDFAGKMTLGNIIKSFFKK